MANKKSVSYMTPGEQIAGVIFFVIYLILLPFTAGTIFRFFEGLLAVDISSRVENMIYYYVLLVVTVVIFHRFLGRTSGYLADSPGSAGKAVLLGLVGLYGLNELAYRLSNLFISNGTNLNDGAISAQIDDAPQATLLIAVLVAPFIEETLFRGLVFGNLKSKSRAMAYLASCLLFALLHAWRFAVVSQDLPSFLLMLQYMLPGLALAWSYEYSGTLWSAIAVHAGANALNLWVMG